MLIFQPFGLSEIEGPDKTLFISGYGLVTLIVLFIDMLFFWLYSFMTGKPDKWTVGKEILSMAFILFTIGLGNYFYSSFIFPQFRNIQSLLIFQFFTLAVGIIPVTITTLRQQVRLAKENLKTSTFLNTILKQEVPEKSQETLTFIADNEKDSFHVSLTDFLYAEASGNYLKIRFLENSKPKNTLLRCTLKRAESQVEKFPSIVKCHRAFLINTDLIEKADGNAQGIRVKLRNTDEEIPVSRSFTKILMDKIGKN